MSAYELQWIDSHSFPGTRGAVHTWNLRAGGPVVFIVHGIGEHAYRYREVAEFLVGKGYGVVAPDLPGHGQSKKAGRQKRCYSIGEMAHVCEELLHTLVGDRPWHLLSHSMGSLIALTWLLECKRPPQKVFTSAPPLALRLVVPVWKELASKVLLKVAPDFQLTNEIDPRMLSYDEENIRHYREDPLVHPYSSARQYDSIKSSAFHVLNRAKKFTAPMFLAVGADDPIVDPAAVLAFSEAVTCPVKMKTLPRAKHEILNETTRHLLYDEVAAWFAT